MTPVWDLWNRLDKAIGRIEETGRLEWAMVVRRRWHQWRRRIKTGCS